MKLPQLLQSFGFTETESQVYLAALQQSHQTASELTRVTGLKRPTVYHALETLQQKGLILSIGSGKIVRFRAEPPEQLKTILRRRELELQSLEKKLDKALPFFPVVDDLSAGVPKVEYFRGKEGIFNLGERVYESKTKEVLALNPSFTLIESLIDIEYGIDYLQGRASRGIKTKTIWQDLPTNADFSKHEEFLREVRLAPKERFGEFKTMIDIFDNSVIIINPLPELFGVLITSFHYAETMRCLWKNIWDQAKPIFD